MRRVTLLICTMLFANQLFAKNSFLVAPTRTEISLDRPQTKSFIVSNNGDESIRIKISPKYFEVGSKSYKNGESLNPLTAKNDDMTDFIRVSPRMVSLKPGAKRSVRISVRPPQGLAVGEYRAHIMFKMVEIAQTMKSKAKDDKSIGMQISFKFETGVAVYGRVGDGDPKLSTDCALDKDGKLKLTVTNSALWRFDGWIKLPATAKPLGQEKLFMVRESKKEVLLNWKPKEKDFEFAWVLMKDDKSVGKSTCSLKKL